MNKWVVEDTPSKLRFTYVLYYYAVNIVEKLNQRCHTGFTVQRDYFSERFRNAMMHYGLGVEMIEDDLIIDDPMFGLTQKILNIDYLVIKDYLIYYLNILSQQLKKYLKI